MSMVLQVSYQLLFNEVLISKTLTKVALCRTRLQHRLNRRSTLVCGRQSKCHTILWQNEAQKASLQYMKTIAAYLQPMGPSISRREPDLCRSSTHGIWAWHFFLHYHLLSADTTSTINRDGADLKRRKAQNLLVGWRTGFHDTRA